MDKLKHTCPACGQHIEYSVDYCGRQIPCPTCQGSVLFPAMPPASATQKLRLQRDLAAPKKKSLLDLPILKALLQYPHWKVVGACVVPFLVVGGLLLGANYLRNTGVEQAAAEVPKAVTETVSRDAWKKMTDLGQIEQQVQQCVKVAALAKAGAAQAEASRARLHELYKGRPLEQSIFDAVMQQYRAADAAVATAQQQCSAARQNFEAVFAAYQKLGGQVDYRSQMPQ